MSEYPLLPGHYYFKNDASIQSMITEESPYQIRHRHDFIEIAYVVEGEGLHYIGDKILRARRGDLYLIPAGESHVFQPRDLSGKLPLRIMNCLYNAESITEAAHHIPQSWQVYHDDTGECETIFAKMLIEQQHTAISRDALVSLWTQLLEILLFKSEKAPMHYLENDEAPIHQAIQLMCLKFMNPLTLQEVSGFVAMSTRHFQRLFKSSTGSSFIQMLQDIRIRNGCGLLQYTRMSVQSIAETVGIHDMHYFYRLFRERCGMTPAAFRLFHDRRGTA
ncbi:AraC family transcriptional regulator [Candidatus Pristimantibacillus sp. PTI5]|uniref:helix-turn-helix transcriptional regulator n=1 Tax=Candidatus Pristimantibacillus sp. PTI5 TaxID=3400422 RepID=UPI003B012FE2